jgi:hypothetical protein
LVELHVRNIPATNLAKWFRWGSCFKKLLTHGWKMDRKWDEDANGQWAITKAHFEDIVLKVRSELKWYRAQQ